MEDTYEVRFGIQSKKKIQEYRIFTTKANSFADAVKKFLIWANNGEEKTDWKGKPYKFDKYPVTEENAVGVTRLAW